MRVLFPPDRMLHRERRRRCRQVLASRSEAIVEARVNAGARAQSDAKLVTELADARLVVCARKVVLQHANSFVQIMERNGRTSEVYGGQGVFAETSVAIRS